MLHGHEREEVELSFSIPADCAKQVEAGAVTAGLVPVAEIARQGLEMAPGLGIACAGAVRSILLFSRVPWRQVGTLAADLSSRTSVELARILLRERFGVEPEVRSEAPVLETMLSHADAALIIGDPALRVSPGALPYEWLDLGAEWFSFTGLPFVFAMWAGKAPLPGERLGAITLGSYRFGKTQLGEIAEQEHARRGITRELAEHYITRHIRFELGAKEQEGLETFLRLAKLPALSMAVSA